MAFGRICKIFTRKYKGKPMISSSLFLPGTIDPSSVEWILKEKTVKECDQGSRGEETG